MKQIIDGKLYDTDKSDRIYTDNNKNRVWYRTQNGSYFIRLGNGELTPVSEEHVKEYLGRYGVEEYIKIFGSVEEA